MRSIDPPDEERLAAPPSRPTLDEPPQDTAPKPSVTAASAKKLMENGERTEGLWLRSALSIEPCWCGAPRRAGVLSRSELVAGRWGPRRASADAWKPASKGTDPGSVSTGVLPKPPRRRRAGGSQRGRASGGGLETMCFACRAPFGRFSCRRFDATRRRPGHRGRRRSALGKVARRSADRRVHREWTTPGLMLG